MSDQATLDSLRNAEFFHGMDEDHLQTLGKMTRVVEVPANAELFHERDNASDVFLILSGRVSIVICVPKVGCRELVEVGAGELVALSPLVGRPRLLDSARTKAATTALAIDGEQLLAFCKENSDFGFDFMNRVAHGLADRLSATRLQFMELAGFHLPEIQLESD